MPYTQLNQLDFNNIKNSLRDYLRANSDFTDYDFEGSALSNLLDVLAYNTYYTAFNTNMVANEMFLDSATLRDNVVSIAKQLGYRPKSATASKAVVNMPVKFTSPDKPRTIGIKRGTAFNAAFENTSYPYSILDDIRVSVNNDTGIFENVEIYSGTIVTQTFTVNTALRNQKFLVKNEKVDTNTFRVRVFESANNYPNGAFDLYDYAENILNVSPTDRVFFVSEIEDENYEIKFGDGVFGRKLLNGELVEISYLVTFAAETNGAKVFSFSGIIEDTESSQIVSNVYSSEIGRITLVSASSGGEDIESIDKIKFNAAKSFGTQNRAVTSEDYEAIVRNIYPAVADITCFGGEEDLPPEYGVVKLVIKPKNSSFLSSFTKNDIEKQLKKYAVAGIRPKVVDPSILYVEMNSNIFYDSAKTTYKADKIKNLVLQNIENYIISSDTEKFNGKFRYSKFVGVIDDSDKSIKSNLTTITLRKDFYPALNSKFYYEICYKNPFLIDSDEPVISSTGFTVREYPLDTVYIEDRAGKIVLYKVDSISGEKIVLNPALGEVDYGAGEIRLYDLIIVKGSFADDKIEIRAKPAINDIVSVREMFLDVDISKSKFTIIQE
jgi:hypothetical protein